MADTFDVILVCRHCAKANVTEGDDGSWWCRDCGETTVRDAIAERIPVYLAARYSRREELARRRASLHMLGYRVTSRWLDGNHQIDDSGKPIGDDGEALVEGDDARGHMLREHFATEDVGDVAAAEIVISFTEAPRSGNSRGGRHVEFGIAIALGKRCIVVGPRENVFHWLPQVEWSADWIDLAMMLEKEQEERVYGH